MQEVRKSIQFYRNVTDQSTIINDEMDKLKRQLGETKTKNPINWSQLLTNPSRKAMVIGVVLAVLNHISGSYALITYAAVIFRETGSIFSSNESALIIAIIQFIGTTIVPFLVDRVGRKVSVHFYG